MQFSKELMKNLYYSYLHTYKFSFTTENASNLELDKKFTVAIPQEWFSLNYMRKMYNVGQLEELKSLGINSTYLPGDLKNPYLRGINHRTG